MCLRDIQLKNVCAVDVLKEFVEDSSNDSEIWSELDFLNTKVEQAKFAIVIFPSDDFQERYNKGNLLTIQKKMNKSYSSWDVKKNAGNFR